MMTFKSYMENLWGDIQWPWRKPSSGIGGANPNPSKTDNGNGGGMGGAPVGAPLGMMKKQMKKNMKKK